MLATFPTRSRLTSPASPGQQHCYHPELQVHSAGFRAHLTLPCSHHLIPLGWQVSKHQIDLSYSWVKAALQGAGLVAQARKRGVHRKRRERRPLPGMLLHIDGSRHQWFCATCCISRTLRR